ncbi:MAG: phenylacetate--CoA ligase [Bacteroidetes bacterium GWE2_29_8]|nr:MAG: phenylacetate--CoA ligase [Bacteroidetes bacterium GWE2_29_8]
MDLEISKRSIDEINKYQQKYLAKQLEYVLQYSKFYKEYFKKIDISKIKKIEDLKHIPVTSKEDLQQKNMDFLCVNKDKIVDYITTSGTMGNPVTFGMTENDLNRLAHNEYLSFLCANGSNKDIYHLMVTLDRRFMAGLAYFLGLRKLGAGIVRVGPGNPELQFDTIKRISSTVFVTIPSFLLKLIEYAEKNNIDYNNTSIKSAICIGEPIRDSNFQLNKLGKKIKEKWDIKLYSTYASTEMGAAFTECIEGKGGHLSPEMLIVEFLDENDNPVNEGELGEITITNIGVEGMPLVRFKTGDICYHFKEKCMCGRNSLRIGPIEGRKKQMIKYKGTTLFPQALYDILNDIYGVENYIIEVSTNNIDTDDILVKIGSNENGENFEKIIKDHFRAKLRVAPSIKFMSPFEITKLQYPAMSRKPITFIDKRNDYQTVNV